MQLPFGALAERAEEEKRWTNAEPRAILHSGAERTHRFSGEELIGDYDQRLKSSILPFSNKAKMKRIGEGGRGS